MKKEEKKRIAAPAVFVMALAFLVSLILSLLISGSVKAAEEDILNELTLTSVSIVAKLEVMPIYNLSLDISIPKKKLSQGEILFVNVNLTKNNLTFIDEVITANLGYVISKTTGKTTTIVQSGFLGTLDVNKTALQIFRIVINLPNGKYNLKVNATEEQSIPSEDTDDFSLTGKKISPAETSFVVASQSSEGKGEQEQLSSSSAETEAADSDSSSTKNSNLNLLAYLKERFLKICSV